jgi:hypothetical protein
MTRSKSWWNNLKQASKKQVSQCMQAIHTSSMETRLRANVTAAYAIQQSWIDCITSKSMTRSKSWCNIWNTSFQEASISKFSTQALRKHRFQASVEAVWLSVRTQSHQMNYTTSFKETRLQASVHSQESQQLAKANNWFFYNQAKDNNVNVWMWFLKLFSQLKMYKFK